MIFLSYISCTHEVVHGASSPRGPGNPPDDMISPSTALKLLRFVCALVQEEGGRQTGAKLISHASTRRSLDSVHW